MLVIKASAELFDEVKTFRSDIDPTTIKLDNIQIIKKIGSGQFGEIFVGLHTVSNSLVAIKTVPKKTVEKFNIQKQIVN